MAKNPLLEIPAQIPFDKISAQDVEPAIDALIEASQKNLDAIISQSGTRTYANTMAALEDSTKELELALTIIGHLEAVATTDAFRDAYNAAQPKASAFFSSIALNDALYQSITTFASTDEAASLTGTQKRFLKKTIEDFEKHGASLSDEKKEELKAINVALTKATNRFSQNVLDATNAFELIIEDENELAGLPESAKQAAKASAESVDKNGYRFTLHAPSMIPVLQYLDKSAIRETLWRAYNTRASSGENDNRQLILDILSLRAKKAKMLGFDDFSDFTTSDRMAKSGANAIQFVNDLREKSETAAKAEANALASFAEKNGAGSALNPWDVSYYSEKLRKAEFDFDEEELRPYFPVDRVLSGMFELVTKLYGIRVEEVKLPAWDESVRAFTIYENDEAIAQFYVDLYPRANKRGGAWMNGLRYGNRDGGKQTPHLGLFCANVNPPVGDQPSLLRHQEVETLFHEFGHLLHHALSEVEVPSLGGTNVAWDFVELPSQIMENFCWERESLALFSGHYQNDEAIPDALFEKMQRARTFRAASFQMRQLSFADTDLSLHRDIEDGHLENGEALIAYTRSIFAKYTTIELPENYAMIAAFSHLFASPTGYACGYYSYKWAEVLDADAFTRFQDEGILNQTTGDAFRQTILAKGDSEDPALLFEAFMNRKPNPDALLRRNGLIE